MYYCALRVEYLGIAPIGKICVYVEYRCSMFVVAKCPLETRRWSSNKDLGETSIELSLVDRYRNVMIVDQVGFVWNSTITNLPVSLLNLIGTPGM